MERYHYRECGLDNVWLVDGFTVEEDPDYGTLVTFEDLSGLHATIAETLLRKPTTLTGAEFKYLRKYCELSQADVARHLRSNEQSIAKWEKAREKPVGNRPAEALFRAVVAAIVGGDALVVETVRQLRSPVESCPERPTIDLAHQNDWSLAA